MNLLLNVQVYFLGDSRHRTKVYWHSILSRHSTFCFAYNIYKVLISVQKYSLGTGASPAKALFYFYFQVYILGDSRHHSFWQQCPFSLSFWLAYSPKSFSFETNSRENFKETLRGASYDPGESKYKCISIENLPTIK